MARKSGWYDDPEGLPGVYRWWDGASWTVDVTTDSNAPPPGRPIVPPAPSTHPASESTPPEPSESTPPAASIPPLAGHAEDQATRSIQAVRRGIVGAVIVMFVLVGANLGPTLYDLITDSDGVDTPEINASDVLEIERGPGSDGRYDGGGLSYEAIQGRWSRTLLVADVPMDDLDGEERVVAESAEGDRQYANVWLGTVDPSLVVDGDLASTAERFADRFAERGYPDSARLDDTAVEPTSVSGADAVRLTRHYAYRVRGTPITGEELDVVVVDTGGGAPAVLVGSVPDGLPAVRAQADRAIASLRVG